MIRRGAARAAVTLLVLFAFSACAHGGKGASSAPTAGKKGPYPSEAVKALVLLSVSHYGGEEALRKASSFREEGVVTSMMQGRGNIVREFRYPDRLRVVVAYGAKIETRLYDGKRGFRQGAEVTGSPLDAMTLQAGRHALPLLLLDRASEIVDKGTDTFQDRDVRLLELPVGEKLTVTAEIDTATGRIVRSGGRGENGGAMGGPLQFLTTYTDFRTVDGVLFPVREINYANGFVTGDTTITRVEITELPDAAFRP